MSSFFKGSSKIIDLLLANKRTIVGVGIGFYIVKKMTNNMGNLEHDTTQKKLYDPVKARAQIDVYKEIYNIGGDSKKEESNEEHSLRLLKAAGDEEKNDIKEYFEEKTNTDGEILQKEIDRLKNEISSLDEINSKHQGFKFYRTLTTKETFEDALIELRERQFEKKFRKEKEQLIGNEPKIV